MLSKQGTCCYVKERVFCDYGGLEEVMAKSGVLALLGGSGYGGDVGFFFVFGFGVVEGLMMALVMLYCIALYHC